MRSLVVFTRAGAAAAGKQKLSTVTLDEIPLATSIFRTPPPLFHDQDQRNTTKVLIKVRAFSCNYRDQSLIFAAASRAEAAYYTIGSEFSGEVISIGSAVTSLKPGDRVIANAAYDGTDLGGLVSSNKGVPSNHSSAEFQVFDQQYLVRIPDTMSWVQGAAFTVGAQTSFGMVRRLDPKPGTTALVTAGRSNTSLFTIHALHRRGVRVSVLSTSKQHMAQLQQMGVENVFSPDLNSQKFTPEEPVVQYARRIGGFDNIFDPFFDIYLSRVVILLRAGGSYVTCGLYNQYQEALGLPLPAVTSNYRDALSHVLMNNLRLQGNCLGSLDDLLLALNAFKEDPSMVPIDSVWSGEECGDFLLRTYASRERFGKVVFTYLDEDLRSA